MGVCPDYPDLPLRTLRDIKFEPYAQLFSVMDEIAPELVRFQVLDGAERQAVEIGEGLVAAVQRTDRATPPHRGSTCSPS